MEHRTNWYEEDVKVWTVGTGIGAVPQVTGVYNRGELIVTETTDENENKVIEYKDKEGNVVLKKVLDNDVYCESYNGWLSTYYIYDDFGHLRWVLQPKAVEWLVGNDWDLSSGTTVQDELCFRYEYDARGRMIIKEIPGAGEVWMVYDERDRLVMTQDSVQRLQGNWLYTNYDSLNRPVVTGIWTTSGDINYHQNLASSSKTYPSPSSNYTILTQTWYDDYSKVNTNGSGLATAFITTNTTNTNYFYTPSDVTFPYPRAISSSNMTKGMITGTKVNVVGTNTYLYAVNYYDDRARINRNTKHQLYGGQRHHYNAV